MSALVDPIECEVDYETPLEVQYARLVADGIIKLHPNSEITSANYPPPHSGVVSKYLAEWEFGKLFVSGDEMLAAFREQVEGRFPDRLTDPYAAAAYLRTNPAAATDHTVIVIGQMRDGTDGAMCLYIFPGVGAREVGEDVPYRLHPSFSYLTEVPNWPN